MKPVQVKRICGYLTGKSPIKKSPFKYMKLGDSTLRVENVNNKYIRIQKMLFTISPSGKIDVDCGGYDTVYTIEELKDVIKRYRFAYQGIKELEKKIKMQGDF